MLLLILPQKIKMRCKKSFKILYGKLMSVFLSYKHTIMEARTLLNADYLDIIYDNRNKIYGGYELRSNYERRVKKAALFVLLGASALMSFSFISARDTRPLAAPHGPVVITEILPPPPAQKIITPPTPPPPAPQHLRTVSSTIPKVIEDDMVPDKTMTEVKDLHNAQPGITTSDGDDVISGPAINTGTGPGTAVVPTSTTGSSTTFTIVEQMPEFMGNMSEYLSKHLHYPDMARTEGVQGQVIIRFVVNEDGSVSNAQVARGIGGGCDEEALHIVSSMPKWKPGKQNGMPVKVYFTLPIKFQLG